MVSRLVFYEIWRAVETRRDIKLEWDMLEFNEVETDFHEIMSGTSDNSFYQRTANIQSTKFQFSTPQNYSWSW